MDQIDIYLLVKSLHIVFVVTWFAGLFYIVRLYVNHTEALDKPEPERTILINQFKKMEKPLWKGITYPSMIMTVALGTTMLCMNPVLLYQPYFHLKLTLVVLLLVYHLYCGWLFGKYQQHIAASSSFMLRVLNEVASVFLVGIAFAIMMKNQLNFIYFGMAMLLFCGLLLYMIIKLWKKRKQKMAEKV
jgi:putative membrane protein